MKPQFSHYDCLEADEFLIYVRGKTKYGLSMRITGKEGGLRRICGKNGMSRRRKN
jgi:hypothetical protein